MKKITVDALDGLFDYLNQPDSVLWIRDKSYKKQIYISSAVEEIWGVPSARFYDDPYGEIIKSSLLPDEGRDKWLNFDKTKTAIANKDSVGGQLQIESPDVLIRIKNTQGEEKFLLDSHYILLDKNGEHVGFTGLVQNLSKDEWYARYYADKTQTFGDQKSALKKHVFDLLYKEAGLVTNVENQITRDLQIPHYHMIQNSKEILFTKRESECIYFLHQGKSAKQTAELLHVSPRTVEYHIGNACEKAQLRSKIELLARVKIKV